MTIDWGLVFDKYGLKVVTRTDKNKSAYVLNKPQLGAVLAAGLQPSTTRPGTPFDITLFLEPDRTVKATFYNAEREGANRPPEPRIGREFIASWLKEGDQVVIGNVGDQIYAAKILGDQEILGAAESIARRADAATRRKMIARAGEVGGIPKRRQVVRSDFVRSPNVVMGAIARADGRCEMPGCAAELFVRDDDLPYLEVHHIVPLAEGGEDALLNAAALCPRCHRELHHGKRRSELRRRLARHVSTA